MRFFRAFWRREDIGIEKYEAWVDPNWKDRVEHCLRVGRMVGVVTNTYSEFKSFQKGLKGGHNLLWFSEPIHIRGLRNFVLLWHPSSEENPHIQRFQERVAWIKHCSPTEFEEFAIPKT